MCIRDRFDIEWEDNGTLRYFNALTGVNATFGGSGTDQQEELSTYIRSRMNAAYETTAQRWTISNFTGVGEALIRYNGQSYNVSGGDQNNLGSRIIDQLGRLDIASTGGLLGADFFVQILSLIHI